MWTLLQLCIQVDCMASFYILTEWWAVLSIFKIVAGKTMCIKLFGFRLGLKNVRTGIVRFLCQTKISIPLFIVF